MNKRIISLFLVFTFLFVNLSSPAVFAEETPTTGYIQIRSGDTIDYYTTIKSGESLYLSAEDIAVVSGYVFEPSENEDYLGSYSKPGETDVLTEVLITPDGKAQTMGKEYQLPLIHQGDQVYFSIPEMLYLLHAQWCVEEGKLIVEPLPDTIIDFMTENFVKIVENKVNQVDLLVNGESEMAHYLRTTLAAVFNDFDPTIFIFWWPGENVVPVLDQEYEEALLQIAVDDEAFLDSYGLQEITKLVEGSEFSQAKSDWSSAVGIYKFIEELDDASENTDKIVDKMNEATETQKSLKFDAFGDVSGLTSEQINECSKALDGISDALEITTLIADAVEVSQRSQKWGKDYIEQIRILTDFDDTGYNKIVTDRVKTVASGLVQEHENPINAAAEKAHLEAVSLLVSKFADETFLGKFISIFNIGLAMAKTDENIQDSLDAADLAYMVDCLFKTEHIAVEEMERSYHRLNGNTVTGDFTQDDLKRLRNSVMLSLRTNLRNRAFIYYLNAKLNDNQLWEASDEAEAIRQKIANDYAMICQLMETEGSDRLILLDDFENMYSDEYGEVRQPVSTDIFHEGEMPQENIQDGIDYEMREEKFEYYTSNGILVYTNTINYPYFTEVGDTSVTLNETFQILIDQYRSRASDIDFDEYYNTALQWSGKNSFPFYDDLKIEITYNNYGYISYLETKVMFSGGAHPYQSEKGVILELETGKNLSFSDIIKGSQNQVDSLLNYYIEKELGYLKIQEAVDTLKKYSAFILTNEGGCFYYNVGDAVDTKKIIIPYTDENSCIISADKALGLNSNSSGILSSEKKDLSVYIGTDLIEFTEMIGNMTEERNYSVERNFNNDYLSVAGTWTDYSKVDEENPKVFSIVLSAQSEYSLFELYYGMKENLAKEYLLNNGWTYSHQSLYKNEKGYCIEITTGSDNCLTEIKLFKVSNSFTD